jgi:hypothetical protein
VRKTEAEIPRLATIRKLYGFFRIQIGGVWNRFSTRVFSGLAIISSRPILQRSELFADASIVDRGTHVNSIQQAYNNKNSSTVAAAIRLRSGPHAATAPENRSLRRTCREDGDDENKEIDERVCPEDSGVKAMAFQTITPPDRGSPGI